VKAITWRGVNETAVETVDDPELLNAGDIILEVGLTATCGSDLHLLGGYIPAMRAGDVLGHEFMGTVAEVGSEVRNHKVGDRVVVCSFISCGQCWYCRNQLFSLCDNGNPNPALTEGLWGSNVGGCYGYSHALGGFAGSHADYVRVPFADQGAFTIPDEVSDMRALFASDAAPTGWTGADQAEVKPGDVVAVWGAGGVGQMAARASMLLGAERVVVIDRFENRLAQVSEHIGAETLNYGQASVIPRAQGDDRRPRPRRLHRGGRDGGPQQRPVVPLRPGQAAAAAPDRPAHRRTRGHPRLPQGGHGVHPGRLRRAGRQVPPRRGDEQVPHPARRPAARPPLHPQDPGGDAQRRDQDRAPGHPRAAARPGPPRATICSSTRRTAASGPSSSPTARARNRRYRARRRPAGGLGQVVRARSTARSACRRVVSKTGTGASSGPISRSISVQPSRTPSAPRATSSPITRR
jgi:threonine dehydrogenase-like Zn-dependent dehydrogenase